MCGFIEPTPPEPTVNQLTRKNLGFEKVVPQKSRRL